MGPKRKADKKSTSPTNRGGSGATAAGSTSTSPKPSGSGKAEKDLPPSAGYLISCDIPTKQYIQHLNHLKPVDKKFILEDLDAEHLLVKMKARAEIEAKVEAWMDEVRVNASIFLLETGIYHPIWLDSFPGVSSQFYFFGIS
jgi:hypothetical protein